MSWVLVGIIIAVFERVELDVHEVSVSSLDQRSSWVRNALNRLSLFFWMENDGIGPYIEALMADIPSAHNRFDVRLVGVGIDTLCL